MSLEEIKETLLSKDEQQRIVINLRQAVELAPRKDKLFYQYSDFMSFACVTAVSWVTWSSFFKAFHLYKYGRGRAFSFTWASIYPVQGAVLHTMYVKNGYSEPFRSENIWVHATKSALCHQVGLLFITATNLCMTFWISTAFKLLPVPDGMHKRENIGPTFRYVVDRMKPHRGQIGKWWAITTALMFAAGAMGFKQSNDFLAKQDRKTISHIED